MLITNRLDIFGEFLLVRTILSKSRGGDSMEVMDMSWMKLSRPGSE